MDSLFFNVGNKKYKRQKYENFIKVDISNGILFIKTESTCFYTLKNIDRMVMLTFIKKGSLLLKDNITGHKFVAKNSQIYISSRQDIEIEAKGDIFILFIADFFLKRYLSTKSNDPIDFLYYKIQQDLSLELIDSKNIDALSIYIIDKIIKPDTTSMRCEHEVVEFILHRFSLFDSIDTAVLDHEKMIAQKAKNYLIKTFVQPPTIQELAHICATNESKLKYCFKRVYKTTIYHYIQKLRLDTANILLKDRDLTIKEIAQKVGYKHQGHFSKLFFNNFGVYPKDLLRR